MIYHAIHLVIYIYREREKEGMKHTIVNTIYDNILHIYVCCHLFHAITEPDLSIIPYDMIYSTRLQSLK